MLNVSNFFPYIRKLKDELYSSRVFERITPNANVHCPLVSENQNATKIGRIIGYLDSFCTPLLGNLLVLLLECLIRK